MIRRRQIGFSLIETVVVLVLVAVTALAASALVLGPAGATRVETTALEIASLLRTVRTSALTRGERRSVRFDLGARTYGAVDDGAPSRTLPRGITLDVTSASSAVDGAQRLRLTFEADGSTPGARIVVGETGRAQSRMTIDVDWLSGRVALRRPGGA